MRELIKNLKQSHELSKIQEMFTHFYAFLRILKKFKIHAFLRILNHQVTHSQSMVYSIHSSPPMHFQATFLNFF